MANFMRNKYARPVALISTVFVIFLGGTLLSSVPDTWVIGDDKDYSDQAVKPTYLLDQGQAIVKKNKQATIQAKLDPNGHSNQQIALLTKQQFADAAKLLQIGHYQQAITVLHKVLAQSPNLPEAHTNLGFAMLNLGELKKAVKSFNYALSIRSDEANAYYGLALVAEKEAEYEIAMGAMRTYIHLRKDDAYIGKARAALDFWTAELALQRKKRATATVAKEAKSN